jgi:hypothetical protein
MRYTRYLIGKYNHAPRFRQREDCMFNGAKTIMLHGLQYWQGFH